MTDPVHSDLEAKEKALKPRLPDEVLATIAEAAKVYGHTDDYPAVRDFDLWCHDVAEEDARPKAESDRSRLKLKQYLKDPTKKRLREYQDPGSKSYRFQDWVRDAPHERRTKATRFTVFKDGHVTMYSVTGAEQKFLCVGGPLAGTRQTEADAKKYTPYNCANSRWAKDRHVARVILVYRPLVPELLNRKRG